MLSKHGVSIAPSTYYARVKTPVTAAELDEAYLVNALVTLHQQSWGRGLQASQWPDNTRIGPLR